MVAGLAHGVVAAVVFHDEVFAVQELGCHRPGARGGECLVRGVRGLGDELLRGVAQEAEHDGVDVVRRRPLAPDIEVGLDVDVD